jgi:capsular exopolysaccharide synthesis family protein
MEFRDYVRIVLAHWLGIVLFALFGLGAAAAYNATQPKVYEATATGLVTNGHCDPNAPGDCSIGNTLAQNSVASYVALATSSATAQEVLGFSNIQSLGLPSSAGALASHISVSQPTGTVLIVVKARAGSPENAAKLAQAWVKALQDQVSIVNGVEVGAQTGLQVVVVANAQVPSSPVLPRTKVNLVIGLVLGLLLGLVYALIRHQFDRRLRSSEEVEKAFGLPVIGLVPQSAHMRQADGQSLTLAVTGSAASKSAGVAEAFRKLRTNLAYMDVDNPPRVIVVTSPKQSDGKSTIAANLAAAIAISGQPVILIDGDLRRPTVADSLAMVDGAGLTDILVGRVTAAEVMQDHPDVPGLRVLASGGIPPNPSELLGSQAMRTLLVELSVDSMVIIDAPPLLPVTDAAVLSRSADGALVVISHGGTLDSELAASLNHIAQVHGRTLGIVFNRMRRKAGAGASSDYYRYEYQPSESKRRAKTNSRKTAKHVDTAHAEEPAAS